jgi:ABC-type lipoprotein release transport system permease subunit
MEASEPTGFRANVAFIRAVLMSFERDAFLRRIAWRNVWRNGRRTSVVVAAIAVGLAGTVVSMAIQFGMVIQMVETAISTDLGHLQIHARGYEDDPGLDRRLADGGKAGIAALSALAEEAGVEAWAPRLRSDGLITSPRSSAGVRVLAIDPAREANITVLADSVVEGAYLDGERRRILMGEALGKRLQVKLGSKIVLSASDLNGDLAGEAFRVAGFFRTSSLELDRSTVYVRLPEAQSLFSMGGAISELVVRSDRDDVTDLQKQLVKRLGEDVEVRNWEQLAPLLVYFVDIFDQMAWIVYAAVFIAMAFGIANVLLMSVFERTREIGVISSIGMSAPRVVAMVTWESLMLTVVGLLAGFALSALGLFLLRDGIDLSRWAQGLNSLGVGSTIVPVVRPGDLVAPTLVAAVTGIVAGLWPAVRASRGRPADALRHV